MSKVVHEFCCSSCGKYFDIKLNMGLNGNFRIHCPSCEHIHYRVVEDGKITIIRFDDNPYSILIEDIWPMKSSCRDFQKETYNDLAQTGAGFIQRLWSEKFSEKV